MKAAANLFSALGVRIAMAFAGLGAAARLAGIVLRADGKGLKEKAAAALRTSANQRLVFSVLRAFAPNLVLSRQVVRSYPNAGTAVVTRFRDVEEVLAREADFAVVYEPRMRKITAGENFFLGMQDSPAYTRDVSNMRLAVRREDVPAVLLPLIAAKAQERVAGHGGDMDVPQDLTLPVASAIVTDYFGLDTAPAQDMIDWTTILFWYLFIDLGADPAIEAKAMDAAARCREAIDAAVQARKEKGPDGDSVLGRCLAMQAAGLPGMDDLGIRNNLIGLAIGAIPTISRAAVQALDQLLDRPDALAGARAAGQADDDALLAAYVFEALRFDPVNPFIYRRAVRDTTIAPHTLHARRIPKETMVLAANLSAMFDRLVVEEPDRFRTDRPWNHYILWGQGMHTCFGAHINRAVIPAVLKPLLARPGLRRAPGPAGCLDTGGTPFPSHLRVQYAA